MRFTESMFTMSDTSFTPNISVSRHSAILFYPCSEPHTCTSYHFFLSPGSYLIKTYGASSGGTVSLALNPEGTECISQEDSKIYGGNAKCHLQRSNLKGSGGFMSGIITLKEQTEFYANIGGSGSFIENGAPGGFNGGGSASGSKTKAASGGGATDLRVGKDNFWHRIIVAGGGGGADTSEGVGGAGGYPEGQGFWQSTQYKNNQVATQTSGYKFGQGGSAMSSNDDIGGAGGGWFGGFPSNDMSSGAGGGSSFILTSISEIPSKPDGKAYAFSNSSPYIFRNINFATGIWEGNGKLEIVFIRNRTMNQCYSHNFAFSFVFLFII